MSQEGASMKRMKADDLEGIRQGFERDAQYYTDSWHIEMGLWLVKEIELQREAMRDARRLLATSRTVGGSPDCVLAAENALIEVLES